MMKMLMLKNHIKTSLCDVTPPTPSKLLPIFFYSKKKVAVLLRVTTVKTETFQSATMRVGDMVRIFFYVIKDVKKNFN